MQNIFITILLTVSIFFIACSAVPTTRYESKQQKEEIKVEQKEKSQENEKSKLKKTLNEDYDIKRFAPDLSYNKKEEKKQIFNQKEIWYSFPNTPQSETTQNVRKITGTTEGFRVLVFSTDDLEELNEVQLRLEDAKGIHNVYSIFEPPFYKLYIGDFLLLDDANSLRRKLIQLDFKESKVIRTTINIFQ